MEIGTTLKGGAGESPGRAPPPARGGSLFCSGQNLDPRSLGRAFQGAMASFKDGNVTNVVVEVAPLPGEGEPVHRRILSDIRGAETCYAVCDGVVGHGTATTHRDPSSAVSLDGVAAYGAAA